MAAELSRRSEKLLAVAPKLRAKGAGRVIEMLARGRRGFSGDRGEIGAAVGSRRRRLFDRLVELGAVRELSGRPSFRL